MHIPKSFKLSNIPYQVKLTEHIRGPRGVIGRVDYVARNIKIATVNYWTGKPLPTEEMSDTFWHEVTHAILNDMNSPLCSDETFVTAFANRLNEVVLTAKL
jgi:hypothetical protein